MKIVMKSSIQEEPGIVVVRIEPTYHFADVQGLTTAQLHQLIEEVTAASADVINAHLEGIHTKMVKRMHKHLDEVFTHVELTKGHKY